jgi:uncharacterized membrane protein SpoIIM required for sporulation
MKVKRSSSWLLVAVLLTIAAILEGIGSARYVSRLPDDWVGIGLYVAASALFAIAAFGFYIKWAQERHKENQ